VFEPFLHQNLLWQRGHKKALEKIDYGQQKIPSWSWMAYNGEIRFPDIDENQTVWSKCLKLDTPEDCDWKLVAELASFRNCTQTEGKTQYDVFDSDQTKRGWIQYDTEDTRDFNSERCIVVGRVEQENSNYQFHILVVKPTENVGAYERIGVGLVGATIISRCPWEVRLV
jgi:hypothetical protein